VVLTRPEGDVLTRFPGMQFWRRDFEALFQAYKHFISVDVDEASGIATLTVKAYRPEDAQRINEALVKYSEQLVNQLNARAREDALSTFQSAVQVAEQNIAQVQEQLTAYRIKEQMLDPAAESTGPLALVGGMEKELAGVRGQLADMLKNAPRSPGIPLLRTRISSLETLIVDARSKITGDKNSVATKSAEYERLDVRRQLDEKALASAFASLEAARLQVQQQQIYLEEIALPNLPDYPLYPKRFTSFAMVIASCFLAYGIAWLLAAGVSEHAAA
jgi:capsular polysaccharide transport system permease protein